MTFEGTFARTIHGTHPVLLYRSLIFPDRGFKFSRKNDQRYTCYGCLSTKRNMEKSGVNVNLLPSVPLIPVAGNAFLENPDEYQHCCQPYSLNELFGQQVLREVGDEILGSQKSANDAKKIIRKRLADTTGDAYETVRATMPSKRAITQFTQRKSMNGVIVQQCIPGNIHPDISTSLIPRGGLLVRFNRAGNRPMLILLDSATIEMLQNAVDVLLDGTFEKCPTKNTGYKQIYNIVIVLSDLPYRQQTFLVGAAFLPDKTQATYVELFQQLLLLTGNNLGRPKIFHFDFEIAAIRAAEQVFFQFIIKIMTCNFHYVKNCIENAKGKNDNGSLRLWRNDIFKNWLREILGASHLPLDDHRAIVNHLLNHPPILPADIQHDCDRFIAYFRRQWVNNLQYVNYWDDGFGGPRTTNGCEGLHSNLNTTIPDKDPTLTKVYTSYREMFAESVDDYAYVRDKPPTFLKKRKPQYIEAESRIIAARLSMQQILATGAIPLEVILKYCRHQTYNSCPSFDPTHPDAQPPFVNPNSPQNANQNPPQNTNPPQILPPNPRNQHPQQFRPLNLPHLRFPHLVHRGMLPNQRLMFPRHPFPQLRGIQRLHQPRP